MTDVFKKDRVVLDLSHSEYYQIVAGLGYALGKAIGQNEKEEEAWLRKMLTRINAANPAVPKP